MPGKHYDLDLDNKLGSNNASDIRIPSQKAVKEYVDNKVAEITINPDDYQKKITNNNKLSADLIEDGTINKIVTEEEKTTWNAKLDSSAIEGLTKTTITFRAW